MAYVRPLVGEKLAGLEDAHRAVHPKVLARLRDRRIRAILGLQPHEPIPCCYCGARLLKRNGSGDVRPHARTRDHVLAKSRGGRMRIACCHSCNQLKSDMSPEQWLAEVWERWPDRVEIVKKLFEMAAREAIGA